MDNALYRVSSLFRVVAPLLARILILALAVTTTIAQVRPHRKPTELVIVKYQKLIAYGAFLTPEGWKRAAKLFNQPNPYPENGDIFVISTGGLIAENWVRGDRAEVETKWDDYFGTIDSALRYRPAPGGGSVMLGGQFSLVLTHQNQPSGAQKAAEATSLDEWKIDGPHTVRYATIAQALRYVSEMRDKSNDPIVRRNASQTIEALKLSPRYGCGSASAC